MEIPFKKFPATPLHRYYERNMMLLIIHFSLVKSFLELVLLLMKIEGVNVFLSEKLSQDFLEKFFGIQRQQGRANENPSVAQVLKNSQNLRMISSIWIKDLTENCRCCKRKSYDLESVDLTDLNKPLQKRRRHRSL